MRQQRCQTAEKTGNSDSSSRFAYLRKGAGTGLGLVERETTPKGNSFRRENMTIVGNGPMNSKGEGLARAQTNVRIRLNQTNP